MYNNWSPRKVLATAIKKWYKFYRHVLKIIIQSCLKIKINDKTTKSTQIWTKMNIKQSKKICENYTSIVVIWTNGEIKWKKLNIF